MRNSHQCGNAGARMTAQDMSVAARIVEQRLYFELHSSEGERATQWQYHKRQCFFVWQYMCKMDSWVDDASRNPGDVSVRSHPRQNAVPKRMQCSGKLGVQRKGLRLLTALQSTRRRPSHVLAKYVPIVNVVNRKSIDDEPVITMVLRS